MRRIVELLIFFVLKSMLWLRYRITVKGLEKLNAETLNRPGGVLFLPNHSSVFIDPSAIALAIWFKYPLRPVIVEYMYYVPVIHSLMHFMRAIPVPNNEVSTNSLKRRQSEKMVQNIANGLKSGDNFLIYPSGRLKASNLEAIGGASGVHAILNDYGSPSPNIVLVRTSGLYGSIFSKAFTGKTPPFFPTFWRGVRIALKNLLFFSPRREISIEFEPAPADFPYKGSRIEINKYLEKWYNYPPDLKGPPGEPTVLIPYTFWSNEIPKIPEKKVEALDVDLSKIPFEVKEKVVAKLSEMTEMPKESITPQMALSSDLGMDSLDISEFIVFLQDQYDIVTLPPTELTTVGKAMGIASKQISFDEIIEEKEEDLTGWDKPREKRITYVFPGKTLPEVFLNACQEMGDSVSCADARSGILTYKTMKLRILLLAEYIKTLPGKDVGILLPASVAASVCIVAIQMAGKVPVMINWTVGPRHLDSVIKLSGIQSVLSSWAFLDRLVNVDLTPVENMLIMLEDLRREFTVADKLKALIRSKRNTKSLLRTFGIDHLTEEDRAVILFTSGTEREPKGVPWTHRNIISNMTSICKLKEFFTTDVFFGFLPPFHSFGLTANSLFGIMTGMRVAFTPDPTDGKSLARGVERWKATITCGPPTFLKKMLRAATPEQVKTLRIIVTGAEKSPPDLLELARERGIEDAFYEGYGVTECCPVITANRPALKMKKGVGTTLPDIEVCIIDPETNETLPANKQGMILVYGPNVFGGYLNKDVESPFVTINGKQWYVTGDLGNLDENGWLTISGRLKRFIKAGGEMISLGALEDALVEAAPKKGWKLVEEGPSIAVSGKDMPDGKPKIAVFSLFPLDVDDVNKTLRESGFSNLVKVTFAQQVEEMPLMGTGKINYRKLEAAHYPSDWS